MNIKFDIRNLLLSILTTGMTLLVLSACKSSDANQANNQETEDNALNWEQALVVFHDKKVADSKVKPKPLMFPALMINGKMKGVSAQEYIADKLKNEKSKYASVSVPDGWNSDCYLVEVATGKTLFSFSGSAGAELISAISGDNKFLAALPIFSTAVELREIPSGKVVRVFDGLFSLPEKLIFSKDDKYLIAFSGEGRLVAWNVESGKQYLSEKIERPHRLVVSAGKIYVKHFDDRVVEFQLKEIQPKMKERQAD